MDLHRLLAAQSDIVDVIADGAPLKQMLNRVALIIEDLAPPAICSMFLVDDDGTHLRLGAAPHLPDYYIDVIDGIEIGPEAGSCAAAAFLRRSVIVNDIDTDPIWAGFRTKAKKIGLKSCWSRPIINQHDVVLGTFALYYRDHRLPTENDLSLVDLMSRLVRVALAQDRKERNLIDVEDKLRDYLSLSSDWLWESLKDGGRSFESSNIRISNGEVTPDNAFFSDIYDDFDAEIRKKIIDEPGEPQEIRDLRLALNRTDGGVRTLNINARPLFDPQGLYRGYRGIAQDITRAVTVEAESRRLRADAIEANRAKTEFMANMSHELRTPLNAILGFSEMIKSAILGPLPEKYRQYAEDIHASGEHLNALVTDILNLTRIEMGQFDLEEEIVAVRQFFETCVTMLRLRALEHSVRLSVGPIQPDLQIRCDRLRLLQAVLNLVSNAIKFTPQGGSVIIMSYLLDGWVAIAVVDTGIGMRPEDIPKALQPFRQIESHLSRKYDGVGLGLALTKSLVELHKGKLELQSELGRGTTATIFLPIDRLVPADAKPEPIN